MSEIVRQIGDVQRSYHSDFLILRLIYDISVRHQHPRHICIGNDPSSSSR